MINIELPSEYALMDQTEIEKKILKINLILLKETQL